ncbi:hypothetical protein STCU_03093 [Strigomonas culicis]|nr:hypothetical protein STCU_03093 [Strigomonas culicis]|eukprot:EPY31930.1 hypothetical protein STCU_03093 [Strigomonas culicis]
MTEREKNTAGGLNEAAAVFHRHAVARASLSLHKSLAPAKLPMMPLTVGEIRYLLPGSTDLFLIGEPHSADWTAAQKLLNAATESVLSLDDKEKLTTLLKNESVSKTSGINVSLLIALASVSPDVCALALATVPSTVTSFYIQTLIGAKMPRGKLEEVLLHVPKLLTQPDVRLYISEKIREFKGKPSLTEDEKASFNAFANFLHELMTKKASENKEIFIADALKPDVEELLKSSDHKSQWEEMKK